MLLTAPSWSWSRCARLLVVAWASLAVVIGLLAGHASLGDPARGPSIHVVHAAAMAASIHDAESTAEEVDETDERDDERATLAAFVHPRHDWVAPHASLRVDALHTHAVPERCDASRLERPPRG